MKKNITALIAVCAFLNLSGASLTPEEALARVHSAGAPARVAASLTQRPQLVSTRATSDGTPAYYIFSSAATTLFVSGDDMATPLLGYADGATADESSLPPQLQWWLGEYAREIEWVRSQQTGEEVQFIRLIDSEDTAVKAPSDMKAIAPLLTSTWNQYYPYNLYAPVIDGVRAVTGCVATAVAQVMNYYKWPQTEIPSISYKYEGATLTSPAMTLDWDNMADDYSRRSTAVQREAVARLMQVVGYSMQMNYGTSAAGGSAASSFKVRPALVDIFGYDIAADLRFRDYYTTEEWTRMIYDNLATCGPMYYAGDNGSVAHAFVCDGYDGMGMFHFNWGWGGTSDGYFVLSALNPGTLGAGGGNGGYNYQQYSLFGLGRPVVGSSAPEPCIVCSSTMNCSLYARQVTFSPASGGCFYNVGALSATFTFGAFIESVETGAVSNVTAFEKQLKPWTFGIEAYNVNIPTSLPDGLYKVYPAYRVGEGQWKPVRFNIGYPNYIYMKINGVSATITADKGDITLSSPYITKEFAPGEAYNFKVTVGNSYPVEKKLKLDAYLSVRSKDGGKTVFTAVEHLGASSGTIPAHGAIDFTYKGTLSQVSRDDYYIVFECDDVVMDVCPVDVFFPSGVGKTYSEDDGDDCYYNLQGSMVDEHTLTKGVYIIRNGATTRKQFMR